MEPIRIRGKLEGVAFARAKDGPYVKITITTDAIQKGAELGPYVDQDLDIDFYPWRQGAIWETPKTEERPAASQPSLDDAVTRSPFEPTNEAPKEEQADEPICPTCQNTREVQLGPGVSEPCSTCTVVCETCDGCGYTREHTTSCDILALNFDGTGFPGPCTCGLQSIACDPCSGRGWTPKPVRDAAETADTIGQNAQPEPDPELISWAAMLPDDTLREVWDGRDRPVSRLRDPAARRVLAAERERRRRLADNPEPDLRTEHERAVAAGEAPCRNCPGEAGR